jgi:hypothetical protein
MLISVPHSPLPPPRFCRRMPKRKFAGNDQAAKGRISKATVPQTRRSPSTHERPPPSEPTLADTWPKGLASLPDVLRAVGFYSLLAQQEYSCWHDAIVLARSSSERIDLSLLPPSSNPRKSPLALWRDAVIAAEDSDLRVAMRWIIHCLKPTPTGTFDEEKVKSVRFGTGVADADAADVPQIFSTFVAALAPRWSFRNQVSDGFHCEICGAYNWAVHGHINCLNLRAVIAFPLGCSSSELYQLLNDRVRPYDACTELEAAYAETPLHCTRGRADLRIAVLSRLPVLELDVWRNGQLLSAENDDAFAKRESLSHFGPVHEVARAFMVRYRRDRSVLLRTILSDAISFDVFDLIDSYGADPRQRIGP